MSSWSPVRNVAGSGIAFVGARVFSSVTEQVDDNPIPSHPFTFDSVEDDPAGYWNPAQPTRLTIPAGKGGVPHLIFGTSFTNQNPFSDCFLSLHKNGMEIRGGTHTAPHVNTTFGQPVGYIIAPPTIDWTPVAGDYYQLAVYLDNNGSPMTFGNASNGSAQTQLTVVRLST